MRSRGLFSRFGPASPRAILAVVGFSVFIAADDLTVVSTMLRPIIGDLGLVLPDGLDDAAWIVNAYLIAFIAAMPIAGRISDIIGRRRTFVAAYLLFLVGTIVIPLSSTLPPFLLGRVLTAIGGGAMVPVALAVVGDTFAERERSRALGTLGAIETLGWVWGPMYGAILIRLLSWRWQFWLNIPFALAGLALVWWALAEHDRPSRDTRFDWIGAATITVAIVSLNLALLGNAEIQSVTGLEELTGSGGPDLRWLYLGALAAGAVFIWNNGRATDPLLPNRLFTGRNVRIALVVNFVIGVALVIAMVDVPLFVNAVEIDIERSAVVAGAILSALTAAMAITSYLGGRITERTWYGPPVLIGMAMTAAAYLLMGLTWSGDTSRLALAAQLAVLGAGLGLVVAPTTAAVVDHAEPEERGAAASVVMVVRLVGLSVGLSALTAWGLARFNALRGDLDLPAITDPGFEDAVLAAQESLTAGVIADTFTATAVVAAVGLLAAFFMRRRGPAPTQDPVALEGDLVAASAIPPDAIPPAETNLPSPMPVGGPMQTWLHRNLVPVVAGLGLVLVGLLIAVILLFARLQQTDDDLATAREDMERVEAGAALFAAQVTGLQNDLVELAPTVSAGLDEAILGLETFENSTLEFIVNIDEMVVIDTEVVIDRVLDVPIRETIPINQTIDTTIEVDGPLGVTIPLDVSVPVNLNVPIELDVSIPINETIPVSAEVPVKLDVPITVNIAETQLADLASSLGAGLRTFRELLTGLGG